MVCVNNENEVAQPLSIEYRTTSLVLPKNRQSFPKKRKRGLSACLTITLRVENAPFLLIPDCRQAGVVAFLDRILQIWPAKSA